jgi:hypothetical protein
VYCLLTGVVIVTGVTFPGRGIENDGLLLRVFFVSNRVLSTDDNFQKNPRLLWTPELVVGELVAMYNNR